MDNTNLVVGAGRLVGVATVAARRVLWHFVCVQSSYIGMIPLSDDSDTELNSGCKC